MVVVATAAMTGARPAKTKVADKDVVISIPATADPNGNPARFKLMEMDNTRPS
jgi:hypothetical protein